MRTAIGFTVVLSFVALGCSAPTAPMSSFAEAKDLTKAVVAFLTYTRDNANKIMSKIAE